MSTQTSTVPAELPDRKQWVAWRLVKRDGRLTKEPINPRTGRRASTTDPATWTDYETASRYAREQRIGGVGFVFTAEDPYAGIDLDGCIGERGEIAEWADEIVRSMDSYTEITPSGRGLHIIVCRTPPKGVWRARTEAEAGAPDQRGGSIAKNGNETTTGRGRSTARSMS
jgi:putative DNA primase/helicase